MQAQGHMSLGLAVEPPCLVPGAGAPRVARGEIMLPTHLVTGHCGVTVSRGSYPGRKKLKPVSNSMKASQQLPAGPPLRPADCPKNTEVAVSRAALNTHAE